MREREEKRSRNERRTAAAPIGGKKAASKLTTDSITGLVAGATVSTETDAPLRSTSVAVRIKGWMPRRGICLCRAEFLFFQIDEKSELTF